MIVGSGATTCLVLTVGFHSARFGARIRFWMGIKRDTCRVLCISCAFSVAAAAALLAAGDPVSSLKTGADALDSKRYATAIITLEPLKKNLQKLADYAAWFMASAQFESKAYTAVPKTLETVWAQTPSSPLGARASLLAGRCSKACSATSKP